MFSNVTSVLAYIAAIAFVASHGHGVLASTGRALALRNALASEAATASAERERLTVPADMALGDPNADSFGEMPLVEMGAAAEKGLNFKAAREDRSFRKMKPKSKPVTVSASRSVPPGAGSSTISQEADEVDNEAQNSADEPVSKALGSLDGAKAIGERL